MMVFFNLLHFKDIMKAISLGHAYPIDQGGYKKEFGTIFTWTALEKIHRLNSASRLFTGLKLSKF